MSTFLTKEWLTCPINNMWEGRGPDGYELMSASPHMTRTKSRMVLLLQGQVHKLVDMIGRLQLQLDHILHHVHRAFPLVERRIIESRCHVIRSTCSGQIMRTRSANGYLFYSVAPSSLFFHHSKCGIGSGHIDKNAKVNIPSPFLSPKVPPVQSYAQGTLLYTQMPVSPPTLWT